MRNTRTRPRTEGARRAPRDRGEACSARAVQDDGLPRDSTVTSTWRQVSGPGTVIFVNPNQAATRASFSQPGTYEPELSASDSELDNSVLVTVTVKS